ncbi:MAG: cache domain-containing sensor histidine kinase [Thauera sp.]
MTQDNRAVRSGVGRRDGNLTPAGAAERARAGQRPALGADGVWALWLIVLGGVVLVGVFWAGVLIKVEAEAELEQRAIDRRTMNLARVFEEHTIRTLGAVDQALLFVKFQYEKEGDALDIASAVQQGMIVSTLYNQVGVINREGIYHLSNLAELKRVDLRDREHFRVHVDQDTRAFFVSKPVLGRASGKWSVQMTRRINQPDGSFGGVAVISIDPFYFTSLYNDVDVGRHGVVTLVGLDGVVRARRAGDAVDVGQDVSKSALFRSIEQRSSGHVSGPSPIDGRDRMYSYRTLAGMPMVVMVGVDREEVMADFMARRQGYFSFALGMSLVIAGFCALSLWLVQRQRRIARRLVEMRERAESANRLKSEFLASVSHELRTPLNGVIGYAELLKDLSEDAELRSYAGVIFESSQHLLALLNSILDLARVEAGGMQLSPAPVDVAGLVGEVGATYQAMAQGKGLELVCSAPEGLTVECDRLRVVQVLNNLVHNALKFTSAGGVWLSARVEDARCVLEVSDSGCGIPAELHEAVFERFRQVDAFETRSQGGTGLGLALCRELAGLMGGSVTVQSQPGEGSVFRFALPLAAEKSRQ